MYLLPCLVIRPWNVCSADCLMPGASPAYDTSFLAEEKRGESLRDLRFGKRLAIEAAVGMVVHVNEARSEHEPGGADDLLVLFQLEVANLDDAITYDADVRFAQRLAAAVSHVGADDDERSRFGRRILRE